MGVSWELACSRMVPRACYGGVVGASLLANGPKSLLWRCCGSELAREWSQEPAMAVLWERACSRIFTQSQPNGIPQWVIAKPRNEARANWIGDDVPRNFLYIFIVPQGAIMVPGLPKRRFAERCSIHRSCAA